MSDHSDDRGKTVGMGEAARLLPVFLPALAISVLATRFAPRTVAFEGRFRGILFAIGIELAALGLVFWADAAIRLLLAWKRGEIARRGAYGLCRHPIFSWWIFSVLPALALLLDSWPFLASALVLRLVAQLAADREEEAMAARFGAPYVAYQFRVNQFLPLPQPRPLRVRRYLKGTLGLAVAALSALAVWFVAVRPAVLGLGATRAERAAALPGDEAVPSPRVAYTQAVSVSAPPETVWAYLVQVGYRRAGWYNFDSINRLAGPDYFIDGSGSSNRIHPELQGLAVGDEIGLAPGVSFPVAALEPGRLLLLASGTMAPPGVPPMQASWVYTLSPLPGGRTRLLTRYRGSYPADFPMASINDLVNVVGGAVIQQPAMLAGLKRRAEAEAAGKVP